MLANRCDIYPATLGQDIEGGATFTYPGVPLMAGVACSAQPVQVQETLENDRMTREVTWEIMFGSPTGLSNRDKLVITTPAGGRHTAFVHAMQDQAGRGAAYIVYATEKL